MSDETARLKLAQLVSLQELNAVTWNEALAQLDVLCDLCLLGQFVDTPPSSPSDGDAYLTGGEPTGAWSGQRYKIAACLDGGWRFYAPFNGMRAFVTASASLIVYRDGLWTVIGSGDVATRSGTETLSNKSFSGTTRFPNGVFTDTGRFGLNIGSQAPLAPLHLSSDGTIPAASLVAGTEAFLASGGGGTVSVRLIASTNNTLSPSLSFTKSRGTPDAPQVVQAGDSLGQITAVGYDGSARRFAAAIYFAVGGGTPGSASMPGQIEFRTTSIGSTTLTPRFSIGSDGHLVPATANAANIGSASCELANGWIHNAWTVISDRTLKTGLRGFSDAEIAAACELLDRIGLFQWQDAVAAKGDASARWHSGLVAQEAMAVLARHGLEAGRYGWFCADPATQKVRKVRKVTRQKTRSVPVAVMRTEIVERDGIAVEVVTETVEQRDQPVWCNERVLPLFDAAGRPVMDPAERESRQKTQVFRDPVLEEVDEEIVEDEPVFDADGTPVMRYAIRYADLHNWLLAALWQKSRRALTGGLP